MWTSLDTLTTGLPDASTDGGTGAQRNLQLQSVALDGQMCNLKGTVPEGGPQPITSAGAEPIIHRKASLCPASEL